MSLIRAAGRTMLASFFVVNGAKSALKPEPLVADAEPIVAKAVPLAQRVAPASVSPYIPEDTKTLVRLNGAAQVAGGLGLASGIGRRGASALLAASMVPHVLASKAGKDASPAERTAARSTLLRNVALLGATLIASQDTQGHPSLAYRAQQQQRALSKQAREQKKQLEKSQSKLTKKAKRQYQDVAKSIESALS